MRKGDVIEALESAGLRVTDEGAVLLGYRGERCVQAAPFGTRGEWRLQDAPRDAQRVLVCGTPGAVWSFVDGLNRSRGQ